MPPATDLMAVDISVVGVAIKLLNGKLRLNATASLSGVVMSSVISAGQRSLNIDAISGSHYLENILCTTISSTLLLKCKSSL